MEGEAPASRLYPMEGEAPPEPVWFTTNQSAYPIFECNYLKRGPGHFYALLSTPATQGIRLSEPQPFARVAELVDATALGVVSRKGVQVRVLSWAPTVSGEYGHGLEPGRRALAAVHAFSLSPSPGAVPCVTNSDMPP